MDTRFSGVAMSDVVGIVFIILKMTDVVDWSWWLITLPIYGPLVLSAIWFYYKEY